MRYCSRLERKTVEERTNLSFMRPYDTTVVYPCKHGKPDYCQTCELKSLAHSSRTAADEITNDIIDNMAPQTLGEDESFDQSSRRSETIRGTYKVQNSMESSAENTPSLLKNLLKVNSSSEVQ